MYYVYVLARSNETLYIGRTDDLKRRIKEHRLGKVKSTRARNPQLLLYEAYFEKQDAINRELYLKTGDGRQQLKNQLKITLMARSSNG